MEMSLVFCFDVVMVSLCLSMRTRNEIRTLHPYIEPVP